MSFDNKRSFSRPIDGCLNPFRTGRCLSTILLWISFRTSGSLNPFRTGRCLSTNILITLQRIKILVSIPFEQGDVFRQKMYKEEFSTMSQSLSNRAMSFDCSCMLVAGIMRSFRPTSQFFWKVKELALDLSK